MTLTPRISSPPIDYYNNGPGIAASFAVIALLATHALGAAGLTSVFRGGIGRDFRLVVAEGPSTIDTLFKSLLASEVLYGICSPVVKLSVLVSIRRIFPTPTIKTGSTILIILNIAWFIAIEIVNFLQCRPLEAFWNTQLQTLPETQCLDFILYFLGNSAANTVVDFATLLLPLIEIRKLHMSWSKKLGVGCVFLLGGVAFAASLTRTISTGVIHRQGITNFTKQFVVSGVASVVEIYVGIIGACIPMSVPVYRKLLFNGLLKSTTRGSTTRSTLAWDASDNTPKARKPHSSYNLLSDGHLPTSLDNVYERQVDIRSPGARNQTSGNSSIPLQGIIVQRDIEWTESEQSRDAPGKDNHAQYKFPVV
ncbi:hypothetical protein F5Y17DRAFT_475180 [Xylariaceae sp. FL0594]|nr:hypothetical protein F5Y17DRAFT_475180 [Xylariaceae sp. FL0594]